MTAVDIPRRYQGRADPARNLGPIKGDGQQGQAGRSAKQLVHNGVFRRDPSRKGKDAEAAGQEARDKVVGKGDGGDDGKPPVARHPSADDGRVRSVVLLVHGVQEADGNEITRPNHGRRVD